MAYSIIKNLPKNAVESSFFKGQYYTDRFFYEKVTRPSGDIVFYRYKKIKL